MSRGRQILHLAYSWQVLGEIDKSSVVSPSFIRSVTQQNTSQAQEQFVNTCPALPRKIKLLLAPIKHQHEYERAWVRSQAFEDASKGNTNWSIRELRGWNYASVDNFNNCIANSISSKALRIWIRMMTKLSPRKPS
ncbi:hypothetical protein POSPLADRAFT_1039489 [Postia placenta MAD-698-R-SB12]|uniref:Uncharacterized protein n=1 Tax=Postia placenta MAD-698-R-SB12 TaxID=670580 RepID=A0A1X6N3W1_9APHY|nr:hypothetical protein POSPLADRAFT_1039489 [Postia placenta MAD-698-R-SB12]OSX63307.1 hypothetical protein POSPLADRAFT_1039489 [Postia placenta MAD-698-R-SB12]